MPSATNTGGASASGATINTPTSPNVLAGDSYQINFTSATTYHHRPVGQPAHHLAARKP
jgi:hypothetical protein